MAAGALIAAAPVGAMVGLALHAGWATRSAVPRWLPAVVGIVAAFVGAATARAVAAPPESLVAELCVQALFAAIGVGTLLFRSGRMVDRNRDR